MAERSLRGHLLRLLLAPLAAVLAASAVASYYMALEPATLMLDEPSAGLNRDEREDLARFILRIKHELGVTMIWIEHDLEMVADLADRIHVLDYGRTLAEGPPAQVLRYSRVIAAYVGTAAQQA